VCKTLPIERQLMSLPYFPMYPTDFEAKTSHLTMAEDGAYNRLLRICWMTPGCTMPTDEAWIMRRSRAHTDAEKDTVRAVLAEFFTASDGRYSNAKLMRVFVASNESHEKRKSAGSKGGKAKVLGKKDKASSNAVAKPKQPEPEPEPYIKEDTNVSLSLSPPPIDSIAQAVSAYNETADRTGWPKVQKLSPARRSAISGRLKECGGVEGWEFALAKAEASPFLTGQTSKPFCASFDFLTKQSNFTKLMEGNYDPRNPAASQRPGRGSDATERDKALADEILAAARAR
jgi:uncharacterized protein YdaU (DUF1376 family)